VTSPSISARRERYVGLRAGVGAADRADATPLVAGAQTVCRGPILGRGRHASGDAPVRSGMPALVRRDW